MVSLLVYLKSFIYSNSPYLALDQTYAVYQNNALVNIDYIPYGTMVGNFNGVQIFVEFVYIHKKLLYSYNSVIRVGIAMPQKYEPTESC